jgi:hypothetical protein
MDTNGGMTTHAGAGNVVTRKTLAAVALGVTTAIMAAFTNDGKWHRFYKAANLLDMPDGSSTVKVTATAGGTAGDIKAIQVIVIGTDIDDAPQTDTLPAFTVDTAGTVTGAINFKTITSIEIPAHDGLGATTKIGISGGATDAILAAYTSLAVNSVFKTATITNPAVPRSLTTTAGGTPTDIKAIQVKVTGKDQSGNVISESLPAFTVDTAGTKNGAKAFAEITHIEVPTHDGNGATTAVGTGALLGIGAKLARNTVLMAFLNNVKEGTAPTVAVSSTALESNTISLASALDGNDVTFYYMQG